MKPTRSRSRRLPSNTPPALFLGTKLAGELRILIRLAAKASQPVLELPVAASGGHGRAWRDAA